MYLDNYTGILKNLCQQNKVKSLYVFGFILTDRFNDDSNIKKLRIYLPVAEFALLLKE